MFLTEVPELDGAACADTSNPDAFFSFEEWETEQARNICRRCPAIRDCLAWALTHREHGIWAGTTPEQRDALVRRHASKEPA
ncbi:MAG TPA: WhiB family transcriptional regulator [Nocardioides sp.]|uniref:WhiB family transcriptional regulator n=1 Tax=Nocardioides sp. TaxID=35761 RepID=UPI002EDB323B